MNRKKTGNRFFALLLCLCMALSLLPMGTVTAFAAGSSNVATDGTTVISTDTTWDTETLSGNVQINSGVTVTIDGSVTIEGAVIISGGGTIARGDTDAYFSIGNTASLTLNGVTVDGKGFSSASFMFDVDAGTLNILNSTVTDCESANSRGGAINMSGGTLLIENTNITNCSALSHGGAVYLDNGATATIKSGTFSGNETTGNAAYGGGFIYNRGSTLTIKGGSFQNNSSTGKGGAIYNAGTEDTETYIQGGSFLDNTSSYSGYAGSGAVYYSSYNVAETVLYISGDVKFGEDAAGNGTDGIFLDMNKGYDANRKLQISSALQYPVHIYLECADKRVIAEGVNGYTLTAADMTKIYFHDVGNSGTDSWYAWLDSTNNQVYVSASKPVYVVYDANGAQGTVTDNTIYGSGTDTVTVQSADGLTYNGYTFAGWNTKQDGSGTMYQSNDKFTITDTTTLYAQWKVELYNVWVGGVQVTSANASDVLGDTDEGATVTYDAQTNTVTLNSANITEGYDTNVNGNNTRACGIYADFGESGSGLNVRLTGENTIDLSNTENTANNSRGMALDAGDGKLNITADEGASLTVKTTWQCLYADGMSITGGTYNLASTDSVAIYAYGPLTIDGANLTAVGQKGCGIWMSDIGNTEADIVIKNSTLDVTGGTTQNGDDCEGIRSNGGIQIENSSVIATGEKNGIVAGDGEIVISGTDTVVTAKSNQKAGNDSDENAAILGGGNYWDAPQPITLNDGLAVVEPAGVKIAQREYVSDIKGEYATLDADGNYAPYAVIRLAHSHNICGETSCSHEGHDSVNYTMLDNGEGGLADGTISDNVLTPGNYYLTSDLLDVDSSIEITGTVNLCLNGHNISGTASNGIFRTGAGGVLNVCDCAGEGAIAESGGHNPVFLHSGGTLNLYGGMIWSTITAVVIDEDPSDDTNSEGGTVNIYGGTVKSIGNSYQAIKVNANMTDAAVNISGGSVTSSNRGISAESGTIAVSGGAINATSYALQVKGSATRLYLSGSPIISGDTADIQSPGTADKSGATVVLHAQDNASSVYTGETLLLEPTPMGDDYYVVQDVPSADMLGKVSLNSSNSDYYLRYDANDNAIRMNKYYTITLPSGQKGYTVTGQDDSASPVKWGESYSFTVTVSSGDKYYAADGFTVKANDTVLTPDENGVYALSGITADQTVTVTGVEQDTTAPTAEIHLGTNTWKQFLSSITFGLFFKETQTVTISADDVESGVEKTEYFVSETGYESSTALEAAVGNNWKSYENQFSIEPKSKNIIYAKVTDKTGNVTYVSSQGIVLYTDAQQDTENISFTKTGTEDVTAYVTLNGNTIDGIYCGSAKLNAGTNYTVNEGAITFEADWLDTLSADDYTLTVHYNPLGVEYQTAEGNVAPATTSIALSVKKAAGSVTITNDISKIYDGSAVSDLTYAKFSTGTVTVEYKMKGADDNTYTTEKPTDVGEYTVRVTVASDGNYTEASATKDFDITYLTAPDPAYTLSGTKGEDGWYTSDVTITPAAEYTVSRTLSGTYSNSLTLSESAENVTIHLKNTQGQMTGAITVDGIKIDKVDPTVSVFGNTTEYLQSDTVTIKPTAGASGIASVTVAKDVGASVTVSANDGTYTYEVTENGTYTFTVTNGAGVTATDSITYKNIDREKPAAEIAATAGGEVYADGTWTNNNVTLSVSNGNNANLGVTKLEYKVGESSQWQTYSSPLTVSNETNGTTYAFRATSASGVTSDVASITVKLDKTAPDDITVSYETDSFKEFLNNITFGLFFKDTQTVTITAADTGSGVNEISYHLGDGEVQTQTADESGKITFDVEPQFVGNIHAVTATDNAGNASDAKSYEYFAIDKEPPAAPTVSTGGYTSGQWTDEDVTISVSGVIADSGIARYQYSTDDGQSWTDMTAVTTTAATANTPANVEEAQLTISTSTAASGTTYLFRAVSNSGMEGTASDGVVVKIDKTEPAISAAGNNTGEYLTSDTVTLTPQTGVSGIAGITVSKDGGDPEPVSANSDGNYTHTVTANGTYTFTVTNGAGVTDTASITYANIDREKPVVQIDATAGGKSYTDGTWTNSDVTLEVSNSTANLGDTKFEYRVGEGDEWKNYTEAIAVTEDTNKDGVTYSFRATSASGVTSDEGSITVKLDKTAPGGDIAIKENLARKFLNSITFGLFFRENVDVEISGTDALSGVESIEYYRSETSLTEDEVKALNASDWTAYTGKMSETAVDAGKFVYYAKITDKAGNVTLFGSDSVTFDLTAPAVSGVTDGGTYYTTQKITTADTNLSSVTLNEESKDSTFTLPGNVDAAYTIIAADRAGNSTTVTVSMRPITDLANPISGLTPENVTSSDKTAIEQVKSDAQAVDTANATETEKTELESILSSCDALLQAIQDTADEIDTVTDADSYDLDTVKSSDKEDIEALVDRMDALLNSGNLTEEDRNTLEAAKETANALLDKIAEVTAECDRIAEQANGYEMETVTADDKAAMETLTEDIRNLLASGSLTDEEAALLNGLTAKLGDLLDRLDGVGELINGLQDRIGGYEGSSVKSTDKEAVEQIIKDAEVLAESGNVTADEKAVLEEIAAKGHELLGKISAGASAAATEAVKDTDGITAENAALDDKDTLEEALKDLTDALENNGGNYTETEQAQIQEKIDRIEEALTAIENAETAAALIEALPEAGDIKVSDEAAIQAAQQAYNALTEHEKELIGVQLKTKLDAVQTALKQAQEDTKSDGTPQTGDSSVLELWIALTFISIGVLLALTIKRKKQRG